MNTTNTLQELWATRANLPGPVGLIPTMGFLHEGHLSLVRRARAECASVVVSIFVNPTQFGPTEDLATYPRDMARDLALLEAAGVDLVWAPEVAVMYPSSFQTFVEVEGVSVGLEGERRPGHFRGVATVVAKLFAAVQPQRAYFGQKDAQQTVVIRQMARDLSFPVEVVICPTVREPDGLAMSSRNAYLHGDERAAATVLYRALTVASESFEAGSSDAEALREIMAATLDAESLARRQYVSCADPLTLQELQGPVDRALLSMAVFVGKTRLIDNLLLGIS